MLLNKFCKMCVVICAVLSITACHQKVQPVSDADKQLSCSELKSEIQRVQEVKAKISKSRGFSGRNVGLALVFWPGIIINEMSGDSAEDAANNRLVQLENVYAKNHCSKEDCADLAKTEVKAENTKKG